MKNGAKNRMYLDNKMDNLSGQMHQQFQYDNSARRRKFGELTLDERVGLAENVYATFDASAQNQPPKYSQYKQFS